MADEKGPVVDNDFVVKMDYTIKTPDGELIESSEEKGPITYIHGHGVFPDGLESRIAGLHAHEESHFLVPAEEGYSDPRFGMEQVIRRAEFPPDSEFEVGTVFTAKRPEGSVTTFTIEQVNEETVKVLHEHPLAQKNLDVKVSILKVRKATKDELKKGQPIEAPPKPPIPIDD